MIRPATVHTAAVHPTPVHAAIPDRGVSRDVGPAASIGTPVKAQATSSRDQCDIGTLVRNRRYRKSIGIKGDHNGSEGTNDARYT